MPDARTAAQESVLQRSRMNCVVQQPAKLASPPAGDLGPGEILMMNCCKPALARLLGVVLALSCLAATAQDRAGAVTIPPAVERAGQQFITREALEAPIRFLADNALEGRGPATRGDELARLYLSTQLQAMGFEPGGPDGQWQQPFDIVGLTAQMPPNWTFSSKKQTVEFKRSDDFILTSGVQQDKVAVKDAEIVFVGYGIQAPEYRWDDFKGVDLKGKVLLMLNNDPSTDAKLFEGERRLYYGRWSYKYESAARQGAAGAIIIHTTPSAGYPWQVVQTSWGAEQFELPAENEPRVQFKAWATEDASRRLMAAAGQDLDKLVQAAQSRSFKPVALGVRTSLAFDTKIAKVRTGNVAGVLRGSDPKLASEVILYSAHHDHIGIAAAKPADAGKQVDRIYNGALDNATGCAQLLTIARAITALPQRPRRSTLILFVAAEEQGLLGSLYYALHPTFAPGKIAANINYDGGNIWGATRDVSLVGSGKSSLDKVAVAVLTWQGRVMKPDQFPDRGFFYRSDQFSFAKIGVPALYFSTGTDYLNRPAGWGKEQREAWERVNYHQPSDEVNDSWNFDGMIQNAQLGFYAGWVIDQADAMPSWNPGDEFEAARKRALSTTSN
jgi:Zn-dependent M28 family amino/carboxypeptidase